MTTEPIGTYDAAVREPLVVRADASGNANWMPAMAAALLSLVLYAVSIGGTYVYDDLPIVRDDPRVTHPALWYQFWTQQYFPRAADQLYRPLVSQSYGIEYWLHGDRAWAFHLVNILLNAGVAAAVAEMIRRLVGGGRAATRAAYLGGLLFAAHPVHVEAAANIAGRTELACTLATLCAIVMFLRPPLTAPRTVAIALLGLAAVLCKEQGIFLLPMLVALAVLVRPRPQSPAETRQYLWLAVLLCWSLAALIIVREDVLHLRLEYDRGFLEWVIVPIVRSRGWDRWLLPVAVLGRYVGLLIFPWRLSVDYGFAVIKPHVAATNVYLWIGFAAALGWAAMLVVAWRKRRCVETFLLLALAMSYSMAAQVIIIGTMFGERLMYMPSAFFIALVAIWVSRWSPRWLGPAAALIVIAASVRTVAYAWQWNDRAEFYLASYRNQPQSIRLATLAARVAEDRGQFDRAAAIMADARRIAPDYWNIWFFSGLIAEEQGDLKTADADFRRTFDLAPTSGAGKYIRRVQDEMTTRPTKIDTSP